MATKYDELINVLSKEKIQENEVSNAVINILSKERSVKGILVAALSDSRDEASKTNLVLQLQDLQLQQLPEFVRVLKAYPFEKEKDKTLRDTIVKLIENSKHYPKQKEIKEDPQQETTEQIKKKYPVKFHALIVELNKADSKPIDIASALRNIIADSQTSRKFASMFKDYDYRAPTKTALIEYLDDEIRKGEFRFQMPSDILNSVDNLKNSDKDIELRVVLTEIFNKYLKADIFPKFKRDAAEEREKRERREAANDGVVPAAAAPRRSSGKQ